MVAVKDALTDDWMAVSLVDLLVAHLVDQKVARRADYWVCRLGK